MSGPGLARRGVLAAAAWGPFVAAAQTGTRRPRVVYFTGGMLASRQAWIRALVDGLAEFGYRVGETLDFETVGAEGRFERLPALAAEVVRGAPDVIFASTTPAVRAAMTATQSIPMVILVGDPLGLGFVRSLSRPEANVTGISNAGAELTGKRLELLRELVPDARRIALLVNPGDPLTEAQLVRARSAAGALGVELAPIVELRRAEDVEPGLARCVEMGARAGLRFVDPLGTVIRPALQEAASRLRLPVMYPLREDVEAGGLIAYGASQPQMYRQGARLVHRLLQGASPSELPVEQPTVFELIVNQRAAAALALPIPPALLARADEVIE